MKSSRLISNHKFLQFCKCVLAVFIIAISASCLYKFFPRRTLTAVFNTKEYFYSLYQMHQGDLRASASSIMKVHSIDKNSYTIKLQMMTLNMYNHDLKMASIDAKSLLNLMLNREIINDRVSLKAYLVLILHQIVKQEFDEAKFLIEQCKLLKKYQYYDLILLQIFETILFNNDIDSSIANDLLNIIYFDKNKKRHMHSMLMLSNIKTTIEFEANNKKSIEDSSGYLRAMETTLMELLLALLDLIYNNTNLDSETKNYYTQYVSMTFLNFPHIASNEKSFFSRRLSKKLSHIKNKKIQ